jgi:hypothetical protein
MATAGAVTADASTLYGAIADFKHPKLKFGLRSVDPQRIKATHTDLHHPTRHVRRPAAAVLEYGVLP